MVAKAQTPRAAGVEPAVEMNPILLKPEADHRSQVVLLGRPAASATGEYFATTKPMLWRAVAESLDKLRNQYDIVVRVARGAVFGTLHTMAGQEVDPGDALRGVGYGAVQGAVEAGEDPAIAATHALEAARELGVTDDEAAAVLTQGVLGAAEASGGEVLSAIRRALSDASTTGDSR